MSSPSQTPTLFWAGLRGLLLGAACSSVVFSLPLANEFVGNASELEINGGLPWVVIYFAVLFIGVSVLPYFLTPLILRHSLRDQTPDEALSYGFLGTLLTSGAICLLAFGVNYLGTLRFHHGDTPLQIAITYLGCTLIALGLVEPFPLVLRIQASMRRKAKNSPSFSEEE